MELAEELAKQELDIDQFQKDRAYELQVAALDKQYDVYKEFIDNQIEAIDTFIDKINDLIDALNSASSAGGSGGGGGSGDGGVVQQHLTEAEGYALAVLNAKNGQPGGLSTGGTYVPPAIKATGLVPPPTYRRHSGIESGFVGGLKSNEEFAKLMDGELVINPRQMEDFMKYTLPAVATTTSNIGGNNITLEMPITVMGNLDKNILPDLDRIANGVIDKLNKSLQARGYVRTANQYSS